MLKSDVKILEIQGIKVSVIHKKIRNINLKVKLNQDVVVSVPVKMRDGEIRNFILDKHDWIKKSLEKFSKLNQNGFYYLGQKYETENIHSNLRIPKIEILSGKFLIHLHEGIPPKTREKLVNKYFEIKLEEVTREFFEKWEIILGVSKNSLRIRQMKGKWGYCHTRNKDICLNLRLIHKNVEFIEYVVFHELCHILVPNHGPNFKHLLNTLMPNWKKIVKEYSI